MFSNFTVGLIFGIGLGGWVYTKMIRRTGGNTQGSLLVAAGAGLVGFLLLTILLNFIPSN